MLDNLYALLAELRDEGTTILLVGQMAVLALSVADRGYVLQGGTVKQSGNAAEIGRNPALVRAYLGALRFYRSEIEEWTMDLVLKNARLPGPGDALADIAISSER